MQDRFALLLEMHHDTTFMDAMNGWRLGLMQNLQLLLRKWQSVVLRVPAMLAQPWRDMRLNTEEVAARRRSRLERGEQNFLWCWQHRGFW